ncbi:TNFR CD27 30 40 95 cysteine rich region [Schistosoma japonicum]|nr:TNFR CD27 30 40 95 cysteine rich region [Schistosoma japonicum]
MLAILKHPIMVHFVLYLLISRIILVMAGNFDELILIDQPELLSRLPPRSSWDLILQNPYEGIIEIAESPVDKFQILINITGNQQSDNERLKYRLRSTDDSLFIELYPQFSPPAYQNNSEEEKIYLQLLCVTIVSLVLVVFVVSIIFSCWWTKSHKIPLDLSNTDAVYYISLKHEDGLVDEDKKHLRKKSFDSVPANNVINKPANNGGQCELIELMSTAHSRSEENNQTKAHVYVSPTVAYATVSIGNNPQLGVSAVTTILPVNYPLPRYVVAAGEMSYSNNNNMTSDLDRLPDGTIIGTPILLSANSSNGVITGLLPDPSSTNMNSSVTYVKLAKPFVVSCEQNTSLDGSHNKEDHPLVMGSVQNLTTSDTLKTLATSSLRLKTLPSRRHVAKEFLDESVLATMSRSRTPLNNKIGVNQITQVHSEAVMTTAHTLPSGALVSINPSVLFIRTSQPVKTINEECEGSMHETDQLNVMTTLPELLSDRTIRTVPTGIANAVPLYVSHSASGNLVELMTASSVGSMPSFSVSPSVIPISCNSRQILNHYVPGHGSDETSGVLSDSEGSTSFTTGAQSNAFFLSHPFYPVSGSSDVQIIPPVMDDNNNNYNTIKSTGSTSFMSLTTQIANPSVSTILPLTVLTERSNLSSATYMSTDLIAEMASCPQHSYLFRQPTSSAPETTVSLSTASIGSTRLTCEVTTIPTVTATEATSTLTSTATGSFTSRTTNLAIGISTNNSAQTVVGADEADPLSNESVHISKDNVDKLYDGANKRCINKEHPSTSQKSCPNPPKRSVSLGRKQLQVDINASDDILDGTEADEVNVEQVEDDDPSLIKPIKSNQMDLITDISQTIHDIRRETTNDAYKSYDKIHAATLGPIVIASPDIAEPKIRAKSISEESILFQSNDQPAKMVRYNVIKANIYQPSVPIISASTGSSIMMSKGSNKESRMNSKDSLPTTDNNNLKSASTSQYVRVTIWLPKQMLPTGELSQDESSNMNKNKKHPNLTPQTIQLWLNQSSGTEVHIAEPIKRNSIHIYDVVDTRQILGTRICRQRYACEHSCDPGAGHACICQRGYRLAGPKDRARLASIGDRIGNMAFENVQGRICLDIDECDKPSLRRECANLGGVCTNRPGDYACLCPTGQPCITCDTNCPKGYWMSGVCGMNQSVECKPCSTACPPGMFEHKPCTQHSDRVCRGKDLIPELVIPYKKNIWFENRKKVHEATVTLHPDDIGRLPLNKSIIIDRGSGYQVRLDFDVLNLMPVLGPVDHSSGNDNHLFLSAASLMDQSLLEPDSYRWSSATGQYHTVHAYSLKANSTLSKLCPYPVPPLYRLGMRVYRNVTSATVPDASLPGHRPVLASCRTYKQHGYFPPLELDGLQSETDHYSQAFGLQSKSIYDQSKTTTNGNPTPAVVACLEPGRLPSIFGSHWNAELASPRSIYYEEKQLCGQLKLDCQHCLASCAEELKASSLTCKPTSAAADNGRSPRLETCFDCCARDNCTDVCDKYPAHRCHVQLCSHGLRLDFSLIPEWPKQGEFLCHVHPAPSRPIYRLQWTLLYHGRPLTPDRFPASLVLPLTSLTDENADKNGIHSNTNGWHSASGLTGTSGGTITQTYRGLLTVQYTSGLEHLPDVIGGTDTMQSAYFWSKQTIPLMSGGGTSITYDPVISHSSSITPSSSSSDRFYSNTMLYTPSGVSNEIASIQVWPSQPLKVSTSAWTRLSGAPCATAEPLIEQLNIYTPALPPYIAMVFYPASVERGHYLRASLALAWLTDSEVKNSGILTNNRNPISKLQISDSSSSTTVSSLKKQRFWVIDLTGQVDQFPGLFRLLVYPDNVDYDNSDSELNSYISADKIRNEHPSFLLRHRQNTKSHESSADAIVEIEDNNSDVDGLNSGLDLTGKEPEDEPLLDYDVGVFEEHYEKSFRLVILDASNRLDIRVKRAIQPPDEMALRRTYGQLSDGDGRPTLVDLLPSLAARQQAMQDSLSKRTLTDDYKDENPNEYKLFKRDIKLESTNQISSPSSSSTSYLSKETFGPSSALVYSVICMLLLLSIILFIGFVTDPDPTMAWVKLGPLESQSNVDGDRVALVSNPIRHHYNSCISRWFRVFLLMGYLCLKSAYTFGVTLTALAIVIHSISRLAASRRSRVLLSQAVAELARATATASALQLAEGLIAFNETAEWATNRLQADLIETERALGNSDWLTGTTETSGEFWSPNNIENSLPNLVEINELSDKSLNKDTNSMKAKHQNGTTGAGAATDPDDIDDNHPSKSTNEENWIFSNLDLGWVHILGATLFLDALWLIHRVLHTVDTAERILYGDVVFIDLTEEGLRRRMAERNKLQRGFKHAFQTIMQPSTIRKLCASVIALLIVTQTSAHLDRLLSQEMLDYIGYYDNLVLPVHLHARLVNVHVTRSAQRLNQYELTSLESEVSRRLRETQFLLHQWTLWLNDIEQEQCRLLLAYKAAAQNLRTKMLAQINRNSALAKLNLPIHMINKDQQQQKHSNSDWNSHSSFTIDSTKRHNEYSVADAVVPKHCRMTQSEREIELVEARRLDIPYCPLKPVVPRLFKDYNASLYFTEVVLQSETWLSTARDYLGRFLFCIFIYVSAIVLWNTMGSVVWLILNRLNLLPQRILFKSDVYSWQPIDVPQQL